MATKNYFSDVEQMESVRQLSDFPLLFSSVAQSCPTLCNPMDCSMPGLPVHHQLLEFTQTHVHWVSDAIQPSHPVVPISSCPQSLPASGSFPVSQLFAWGGQSTGVSASASVPPLLLTPLKYVTCFIADLNELWNQVFDQSWFYN